ncbi:LPS-assembly protein LptD [Curvibacter sp. APW13]|uniref:LPS-assembly protein LptD n=1 Tax=Curvibacter sp. APW13 TaxID=3077236 RepID=UPI0028E08F5C|nr:LPS-assembly protein LptD [Curvibacter sp. APW13]MDT8990501.1 LPS-assembly protein LptD [Curvibacter sp. APW13]
MRLPPRWPRPPAPTLLTLALLCVGQAASAQDPAETPDPQEPAALRSTSAMPEALPASQVRQSPVFLEGDQLQGRPEKETVVEGDAVLRRAGTTVRADRLEYDPASDRARATGQVRVNRMGNVYEGPVLELGVEKFQGHFEAPRYQFLQNDAHGEATRADFIDENHTVVHNATYTTCRRKPGPDWLPDWILRADKLELDNEDDSGVAHGAVLSFKGVPLLPVPAISFPLSDKRRSGFLPPTIGADSNNGTEILAPYYWNIAPNRDATITPTLMTARGVDLGTEFRYLEPRYSGTLRANYMPSDRLRGIDRWGYSLTHNGSVDTGVAAIGDVALSVSLNHVSDNDYWTDFTRSGTLTQRLLPSQVVTSWGRGPWSVTANVQQYQTLQSATSPITPPYDRVPQVVARYTQYNNHGMDWSVEGDMTRFESDPTKTLQPNAQRAYSQMQAALPLVGAAGYLTPKVQLHAAAYQFDTPLSVNGASSQSSVVPTFSLDSGVVFERDTSFFGTGFVQTLEPRAFYVYTPYRNQSMLPNYDTGIKDFNFASIYTENAFVGHDKISDNNLLTLGVSSRLLDAETGAQFLKLGVAQRFRFEDQQVTYLSTDAPAKAGFSDVLLGASANVNERWTLDSVAQYNALNGLSERSTVSARYNPGHYRVLNMAYRFARNQSEQVDVSWQWPLNDLWGDKGQDLGYGRGQGEGRYYAVGRMNYSMNESRLVDTVLGLEYDAGCWLSRVVLERTSTSVNSVNQRIMFQLEFVGFTKLGISPQRTLTSNISRYQNLRDAGTSYSRFSNYD